VKPEPFRIEPEFRQRIWGELSLAPVYPEKTNLAERVGEAWLTDVKCRIANGPFAGKTLGEAWQQMPAGWRGDRFPSGEQFPLLVKFIFPADKLSIQVHPDDAYAAAHEKTAGGRGKTEMWHVVSAKPGATLLAGLRAGVTRESFAAAIADGTVESLFQSHEARAGDTFYLPAGTPHTVGPNMILCEVQQYSDLTYRVYDYNRQDENGKPRDLHIQKALDVIRFGVQQETRVAKDAFGRSGERIRTLVQSPYFDVVKWETTGTKLHGNFEDSGLLAGWFIVLVVLEGNGNLAWSSVKEGDGSSLELQRGECWFIPAGTMRACSLYPKGNVSLLLVTVAR
jgi:mannose-6-phosphate isomerase